MTVHHHQRPMPELPDDVVLSVRNVSKKFCRNLRRSMWYGMQDLGRNLLGLRPGREVRDSRLDISSPNPQSPISNNQSPSAGSLRRDEFWALQDINFELKRGECLGLIGQNGSGKTTLLRVISGIFPPDGGEIVARGRVGALISLGAGFHPHMTGRENIYLNGTILGMKRSEIDAHYQTILDFAEIGEFIDAPVSTYSSGMTVRLGFAIATVVNPDLLLIDEVLAVGDAGFRHKCYRRIGQLQQRAAIIFVTHNVEFVAQICDKVLFMRRGVDVYFDDVSEGIAAYMTETMSTPEGTRVFYPPILDADLALDKTTVAYGGDVQVVLRLRVETPFRRAILGFAIRNETGMAAAIWNTLHQQVPVAIPAGEMSIRFRIGPLWLLPGKYYCSMSVREEGSAEHTLWLHNQVVFTMTGRGKPMSEVSVLLPYHGHTLDWA